MHEGVPAGKLKLAEILGNDGADDLRKSRQVAALAYARPEQFHGLVGASLVGDVASGSYM